MAAGDFSASNMADIIVEQRKLFADPRTDRELKHPVNSAKALLENQQVRFIPQMLDGTCIAVKAVFLKNTDNTIIDASVTAETCEIAGAEGESDSVTYNPNIHIYKEFSVSNKDCKDTFTYEQKLAREFMRNKVLLERSINDRTISFLSASAMNNGYTDTEGTITGPITNFPKSMWTEDLLGEFRLTAEMNKIYNPVLLTGTNFYVNRYHADFDARNDDERDRLAKYAAWSNFYFDPLNIRSVLAKDSTFMFEPGAAAFWNKRNVTSTTPIEWKDKDNTIVWSEPSLNLKYRDGNVLKDAYFDVYSRTQCIVTAGNRLDVKTSFRFVFQGGLILAPSGTSGSGILEFVKVADPV